MSFPRRHYVEPKSADQMSKEMLNREIQNMQKNLDVTIAQLEATFKDIIKTDSRRNRPNICQAATDIYNESNNPHISHGMSTLAYSNGHMTSSTPYPNAVSFDTSSSDVRPKYAGIGAQAHHISENLQSHLNPGMSSITMQSGNLPSHDSHLTPGISSINMQSGNLPSHLTSSTTSPTMQSSNLPSHLTSDIASMNLQSGKLPSHLMSGRTFVQSGNLPSNTPSHIPLAHMEPSHTQSGFSPSNMQSGMSHNHIQPSISPAYHPQQHSMHMSHDQLGATSGIMPSHTPSHIPVAHMEPGILPSHTQTQSGFSPSNMQSGMPHNRIQPGMSHNRIQPGISSAYHPQQHSMHMSHDQLGATSGIMQQQIPPYHPAPTFSANDSLSHDSSRLLTRVAIPKFSGDKRIYESWKAAFLACVDNTLATPEYKLLRLRNSLEGEALQVIESLGHSAGAYHVAKERLERKYGGKRRQMVLRLEELDKFKPIRDDNAHDLERFSELLDVLTVNLIDVGQHNELGGGALYITLQRKLNENLLSRYNRWVFEKGYPETVESLRTFVNQESEFLTTAAETVGGILKVSARKDHAGPTFVTQSETKQKYNNRTCVICNQSHGIWACETFKSMNINQRWDKAKEFKLCFRCLSDTHRGERCPRSRICGINGCTYNHNRLLHKHESNSPIVIKHQTTEITHIAKDNTQDTSNEQDEGASPVHSHTTTLLTDSNSANRNNFIALRTVPVHLKCGNRTIRVNALLDDASSRSYINSDIAAQLGLEGIPQRLTVQVLNNNQATLDSSTVDFVIESIDGTISRQMSAYTTKRVTGNLNVVNWNKHKGKWSHLKEIHFPQSGPRVIVDILIGVDQSDLHCSLQDIGGGSGEPIARLTPLGWTCIGGPYMNNSISTNLTFFQHDIADLGGLVRRFWEIEELPSKSSILVKPEEKIALAIVSDSLAYNDGHYSVSVPWKSAQPELPNNYKMAVNRLENTEKRLLRAPEIASAYQDVLNRYKEKAYIRQVPQHEVGTKGGWFLPHFPVLRPDKTTTKTRIVFDASAKLEGISLNDIVHKGPKLQNDLLDVLIRFRRQPIALMCDITEMYLQIELSPEDRPYHRFLWRDLDQRKTPDVYEFSRVVFGVNSSPFQAQFVLQITQRTI